MPDNVIKTTLAIDGEAKYKRAIDQAKTSIRNMGSALTLATAEFKRDGDAMKLMETRAKTLKGEIAQQQQIVKSLEGAVKEATTAYGENSKQAEKWQAELNRAKAALAGLELEFSNNEKGLDKNGKAFGQAGKAADQFGAHVKKAGETANAVNFLALDKALTNTTSLLSGVFKGITKAGGAAWDFIAGEAHRADDLLTRSKNYGLDVVTLQEWDYAAQIVDTDVDTMTKAMDKLRNGGSNVESALKTLGIKASEYFWYLDESGAVDIAQNVTPTLDLFWQVVDALGAMSDEEQRNAITQELFGKSYREMLPLIEAGKEGWDAAANEAKTISEEAVNKLATFDDALVGLNNSFDTLKATFAEKLAPAFTTIADTFSQLIDRFTEWANTPEGTAALEKLGGAIESVFTAFTENVNFESIVSGATGAIQAFTGALDWVSSNAGTVADGLKAILFALAGFKVIGAFSNVIQLINTLKGFNGGGSSQTSTPTTTTVVPSAASSGAKMSEILASQFPTAAALVSKLFNPGTLIALSVPPLIDAFSNPEKYGLKTSELQKAMLQASGGKDTPTVLSDPQTQSSVKRVWGMLLGTNRNRTYEPETEPKKVYHSDGSDGRKPTARKKVISSVADDPEQAAREAADAAIAAAEEEMAEAMPSWAAKAGDILKEQISESPEDKLARIFGFTSDQEIVDAYDKVMAQVESNKQSGAPGSRPLEAALSFFGLTASDLTALSAMAWDARQRLSAPATLPDTVVVGISDDGEEDLSLGDSMSALPETMQEIGKQAAQGLAQGIEAEAPAAVSAAQRLAESVREAVRGALQIASPSKVMMQLGAFVTSGFAEGIDSGFSRVKAAVARMAAATAAAPAVAYGGAAGTYYGQRYDNSRTMHFGTVNVNTAQDMHDLMSQMDDQNRYEREGMGG